MVAGTRADAEHLRQEAAAVLLPMGLRLSEEKTTTQNDCLVGAFAHVIGVARIEAPSGKISRHRLNRQGNRAFDNDASTVKRTRTTSRKCCR
jgi:hypothetical protein